MRFFRLLAITVLLLACVVLSSACAGAKGADGPQGPKGDTGAAGIGVENIVNNGDGTFTVNLTNGGSYTTDNLTGPQGLQGAQGIQGIRGDKGDTGDTGLPGAGIAWQGEWSNAATYSLNDAVGYQGSSYISKQDANTNHVPTDTSWWDLWVEKGNTGDHGLQGEQGIQGETGATGAVGPAGPQGPQGVPGPNMIVAMGYVYSGGWSEYKYNISSSTWDSTNSQYVLELTSIYYQYFAYVTLISIRDIGAGRTAEFSSTDGKLCIRIYDLNGNRVQEGFSFMVLQCP